MKKIAAALLISSTLLSGCGSIINGTSEYMSVSTTPETSHIQLLSKTGAVLAEGQGSLSYNLDRGAGFFKGADYQLVVQAKGYKSQTIPIVSTTSGWYIVGNLFSASVIGWLIVDPYTGGMWVLEAKNGQKLDELKVTLVEDTPANVMSEARKIN